MLGLADSQTPRGFIPEINASISTGREGLNWTTKNGRKHVTAHHLEIVIR